MHAVLFDLDGTLVDNMPFHFRAWRETAAELGVQLDDARIQREFAGKKNDEIIPALLQREVPRDELTRIADGKEAHYRALVAEKIAFVCGAREYIQKLRIRGIKTAIASAAPPENRKLVLDTLQAWKLFDAIVGGEECKRGKPFPDIFLLAAKRVGIAASDCLVYEDAVLGVQAAAAAGCRVIGVTTSESAAHLIAAGAESAVSDFESVA